MTIPVLPGMPEVRFLPREGGVLAYYEAGPRQGIPIVLCHGYPEIAYTWRHQIAALAAAGRWVIAPDQRGYGLSLRPDDVDAYDLEHLTGDLVALLDHLGAERAVFCGHDWGGGVVWRMPLAHPARAAGVIGVNTPHMPPAPIDPIDIMRARMGDDMYIVHFQRPGEADAIMNSRVAAAMDFYMRHPAPGAVPTLGFASERAPGGPSVFPLVRQIETYDPAADPRERLLPPDELQVYVDAFERTGFTGGINWYRNISRDWAKAVDLPTRIDGIPCLMVTAELDPWLPPAAAVGMEDLIGDLETVQIDGVGHWTQQEAPGRLNAILIDWLNRRFPG